MEQNQESTDGDLEKLALISDAIENLFPDSQSAIIFELEELEYKKIQSNFRKIDSIHERFKIDMSGVEIIFILKGSEPPQNEIEKKDKSLWERFMGSFSSKKSS
jgi:hypothetical protein|tara:strand:+ start:4949 stop:5260 length:312 start_codon:yes stop_codon:yes gene_type:complete